LQQRSDDQEPTVPTAQASPETLIRSQIDRLRDELPGVRDGDDDAIHDARVATRRLREALPLLRSAGPGREKARRWLRRTGRRLGRIRDLDVMLELAIAAVQRLPAAAVPLQHLMVELRAARDQRLRRAVKRLERQDQKARLAPIRSNDRGTSWFRAASMPWAATLADRILARTDALDLAVAHAGGVHFPNRVHAVRMAAKKLRYTLEAAEALGTFHVPGALALLKRVQDVLGDLHDRHVFLQKVTDRAAEAGPEHAAAFDAVRAYVETECRDLHRRYLDEREDLTELCDKARAAVRPQRTGSFLAAGALMLAAAGAFAMPPAVRRLRRAG
jgi:CHAD domain-containing protein